MVAIKGNRQKWLRRIGLIIGLLVAVWWVSFGIVLGIDVGLDFLETLLHTALPGLIVLVSIAIARKWEPVGGVLLIVEGLIVSIAYSVIFGHCPQMNVVLVIFTMSLPLLASGVLFILSWRESRKPPEIESS